jgi:fatty acid desaturase
MSNKSRFSTQNWLRRDLKALAALLRQRETWMLIAMTVIFMAIGAMAIYLALHFDITLKIFGGNFGGCAAIGDLDSVLLVYGGIAFVLAMLVTFGEFANYVDNRRRGFRDAWINGRNTLLVLVLTVVIGSGILFLFERLCS